MFPKWIQPKRSYHLSSPNSNLPACVKTNGGDTSRCGLYHVNCIYKLCLLDSYVDSSIPNYFCISTRNPNKQFLSKMTKKEEKQSAIAQLNHKRMDNSKTSPHIANFNNTSNHSFNENMFVPTTYFKSTKLIVFVHMHEHIFNICQILFCSLRTNTFNKSKDYI